MKKRKVKPEKASRAIESSVGIQGSIYAENGSIGSIWTTGPIGNANFVALIHAGDGINEVRARSEGGWPRRGRAGRYDSAFILSTFLAIPEVCGTLGRWLVPLNLPSGHAHGRRS